MLVEADREDDEPGREEGEEPDHNGQPRAAKPHQHLVGEKLTPQGEIARVSLHAAARAKWWVSGMFFRSRRMSSRHDIAPGACRFRHTRRSAKLRDIARAE